MRRFLTALTLSSALILAAISSGQTPELTSSSYRLQGGQITAGGQVMTGTQPGSPIGSLMGSLGQPGAPGFSGSETTLAS